MNTYAFRSTEKELIDAPGIPFADWFTCLKELNTVNTYLGGHAITVEGVRRLLRGRNEPVTIAEIGCGGGDNLNAIFKSTRLHDATYMGIDINEACIEFAKKNCSKIPKTKFICSDYKRVNFSGGKPDVIFNSLFCHHFSDAELVEMLRWMKENSKAGFFINDLQRHPFAFHSIRLLTKAFSRSYLVKNDAPISVMRGFRRHEWSQLMKSAGIDRYEIGWRWAFRYLVIFAHEPSESL
jgi:ubiquinone/menaquinone biosynthesis C-methylase UbiE